MKRRPERPSPQVIRPFVAESVAFSSRVGHHVEGQSLIDFLAGRFTYFDRKVWTERITSREILLNGQSASPASLLKNGDEVRYMAMTRPEPKIPSHIPVLFEDEDLLIVNKPAHIPVHPGGRYLRNTLIHVLKKMRKLDFLVLSHRLDRETTGVCVLAKTTLAKDKMYWQFFNGDIEKTYLALVWGVPSPPSGLIDKPLGTATPAQSKIRIKQVVNGQDAKTAKTKYHTLGTHWILAPQWAPPEWPALMAATKKKWAGQDSGPWPLSLVECRPLTGRTNQIRVHLASIGAGIVGDKLYDPQESVFIGFKDSPAQLQGEAGSDLIKLPKSLMNRLVLDAHALHAKALKFRHPRTGKTITIEAPPPDSWRSLMPQLQSSSRKKT